MLFIKRIQNIFSCFLLLISLISFSGFIGTPVLSEKPQIELVAKDQKKLNSNIKQFKPLTKGYCGVLINHYTIFNFKNFLNIQAFNFSVTLKSQKETSLPFIGLHTLEQNLIAHGASDDIEALIIE